MFSSVMETCERLKSVGYLTDAVTPVVVYLAAKLNKPVLLEGPAGSGKTQQFCPHQSPGAGDSWQLRCQRGCWRAFIRVLRFAARMPA